eukprot:gnl/Chilomastix_cuspidata/12.p1 GENE.gnl/Chilomastix_cuspidata/12~~gnl/Chilomastix_cuspidata/12.p1  ORF type:complete len:227 (-),score=22.48 gnl/Chilomastix_cuspidata/12:38-688(-)
MLTIFALIAISFATTGFDLSYFQGSVSQSSFECLYNDGYRFGILQAQRSNGKYNSYAKTQYNNAKNAGFKNVDWYIFPDMDKDAYDQVSSTISSLKSDGLLDGNMIWIDIEGEEYFSDSCSANVDFIQDVVDAARSMWDGCGNHNCIGMYTSNSQWDPIACGSTQFSDMQLWWPRYDGKASTANWSSFGGWSSFNIKQYDDTTDICSTQIDKDWYD